MPIRFHCEACEARVKVPAGSEGRRVKCPRCGHLQRVPRHIERRVAVGVGAALSDDHGVYPAGEDPEPRVIRTSTKNAPRKGGLEAGDSLADLARSFDKNMTPPPPPPDP